MAIPVSTYVSYTQIADVLPICKGGILYVSSDILDLAVACRDNGEKFDCERFIRSLQEAVGENGMLLFPTFSWDFCNGVAFDYRKTAGKTGSLGNAALKMPDFRRTRHPIYSFAVWGQNSEILATMDNVSSFGADSPFAYLHENDAVNLLIGVDAQNSFTFVHYVEEQCGAPYRYLKNFTANYIDTAGNISQRIYSMFVRDLERNVATRLEPMEQEFLKAGVAQDFIFNGVKCMKINLCHAFELIKMDILENKGRKIVCYDGQEN